MLRPGVGWGSSAPYMMAAPYAPTKQVQDDQ
jgi:hypothetical protein